MSIRSKTWRYIRIASAVMSLAVVAAVSVIAFSTGPPASHTGAPGESLCTSCHTSFPPNSGPGQLTLILPTTYTPGDVHTVRVRLQQINQRRWGFQITALTPANQMAGSWIITDALRTQTVSGLGRVYVEHTSQGTFAGTLNGPVEWEMNWQAPSTNVGNVTFYAAGNAANNDGFSIGDYIYSTSTSVPPAPAVVSVTIPNGGETWSVGTVQTIQWSTSNLTGNVKIELSRNGGSSFPEILFANTANDGIEDWTVLGPATSAARVRISSVSSPTVADTSDADFSIEKTPGIVAVPISSGWNMISNPVTTADDSVRQLYPTSDFPFAYGFNSSSGYFQSFRMLNGVGYWERFASGTTQVVSGSHRTVDSIDVMMGWNMIGTISEYVDTADIVSDPPGLRASPWFGFSGGYVAVSTLEPGKAYWVKANAAGKFILASPTAGGLQSRMRWRRE
jgi:hypothetical protein